MAVQGAQPSASSSSGTLTVPPGFVVERVAGPPLVDRPIVADFDEQGRLYVADSSGSNDKVDKQLADRPHRIVRLEDSDGDGRFDRSVVFADRMMFPEGAMWLDGSLYVAAPPSIWKLTDTDGDGVADRREEWFQGKTLTGCANDLHGPYLGPDGWIYWTKGAFAEQTYEWAGKPFVTRASHIFRRRPGADAIDIVMTGGMDNPVDVAFTATGEQILSATFVEQPQLGKRDGLLHAVYGGVYGKPHAVIDGHKRTGDLMPVMAQLGPAVPAGLTRYGSATFGDGFRDNFFAAMFNLRKVTRHELEPSGATFAVRSSDFLVSDSRDFHPTDVIEDADGSLLIVDTGPWFKLCCPTSQLAKPDVLGGIYRVRRAGAAPVRDPRGLTLVWNALSTTSLARLLGDGRPAVRRRAAEQLARGGQAAVASLRDILLTSSAAGARREAVWTLARMDDSAARAAARLALDDGDESVRHAAIHSAALWRDAAAVPQLRAALRSGGPAIQRAAAEALGRAGDARAVADLLALAATPLDRVLEHSVTYALIEIDDPTALRGAVQPSAPGARRAALIALDQMDHGSLDAGTIVPLLDASDRVLKDTAWWIAGHHPEWGEPLARYFASHLAASTASGREDLQQRLVQFGDSPAVQALLAAALSRASSSEERAPALGAMSEVARTRLKVLPAAWIDPLIGALGSRDDGSVALALSVVRSAPARRDASPAIAAALRTVGQDRARPVDVRLNALAAVPGGVTGMSAEVFALVVAGLEPSQPSTIRSAAATVVERAELDAAQRQALIPSLETSGPLDLPRLLHAFAVEGEEGAGLAMVAALGRSKGRSSVRADALRPVLARYPPSVQQAGDALLASSRVEAAGQLRQLESLLPAVQGGNVALGQAVFNGSKAGCSACHAIGYMGGRIGPDLTRIGQVRSERDLLEAVLFPSASFARGYEPVVVRMRSGETRSGLLRSNDLPDEIVVATERDETRISRRDIAEIEPGTISLMPPGFGDLLTRTELADLLAFLKSAR